MAPCSADDHDTTDFFCGACGEQLHTNAAECDPCKSGEHDVDGFPFCRCCGRAEAREVLAWKQEKQ